MGHSTKPRFFSENGFESVQTLEPLLTEIPEVYAINYKRDKYGLEKFQDKCSSPSSSRQKSGDESKELDSWASPFKIPHS